VDDEESRAGRYANYFQVGHNAHEVLIDFGQFYRDDEEPRMHTRIVTHPSYASALRDLLAEALERYEGAFGPIPPAD
jgi:hypothetical protein